MTSDQVQLDTTAAPDAAPSQPKPVRRRTTKKVEAAEQPTLPETTPEEAPAKPKRTRVAKAKTPDAAPETSAPAEMPVAVVAAPAQAAEEAPAARPSIPARFPSRFKRVEEPAAIGDAPAALPQGATAIGEQTAVVSAPPTDSPMTSAYPPLPPADVSEPTRDVSQGFTEAAPQENGTPNGEFNGPNGEFSEGGGRMRYRERREFRRQQRMQQRQDRLGPNGEPLPPLPPNGFVPNPSNGQGAPQNFNRDRERGQQNGFQPRRREYDFFTLKAMGDEDLENAAREYGLEPDDSRGRDALLMALMDAQARAQNSVLKTGILDAHDHNKAFLRCEGYTPSEADVYVSQTQIKRFNLKSGDLVFGTARAPKENERFFGLLRVESINGLSPDELRSRKDFEKLTPIFPTERYNLETEQGNITARIIDLISPVGKGQRGLIVAPPKAGKTTLIKSVANSIAVNNPEAELFVLLIDERPEEVTDISRSVRGTVVASTFDEMPDNHMRVADIVMERAKRLVEMKRDVVILMDSITRLSRASNLVVTPSGRTLSGGLDPAAMYRPKRMFGAARNIEEGGSLTILATALVDTGSRMDEMIFEEFKGTGNMDLVLDRDLFNQRIFPAIDINKSGTRRDDLLLSKDELAATFHLRQTLARLDNDQAVKLLIDRLKNTKSNANFMEVVAKSARQAEIKGA